MRIWTWSSMAARVLVTRRVSAIEWGEDRPAPSPSSSSIVPGASQCERLQVRPISLNKPRGRRRGGIHTHGGGWRERERERERRQAGHYDDAPVGALFWELSSEQLPWKTWKIRVRVASSCCAVVRTPTVLQMFP
jgi:hypothetical protein